MKTFAYAGLAGVFLAAPGTAIASFDSLDNQHTKSSVDLDFASPLAIAGSLQGTKGKSRGGIGRGIKGGTRGYRTNGNRGGGRNFGNRRGLRKGGNRSRGFSGNFGFFFGGYPSYGYSPSYYYTQPAPQYVQQPSYYPVPYPVPTPVAYPAPAPTTVVVHSGEHQTTTHSGKRLLKPGAQQVQSHYPVTYDQRVLSTGDQVVARAPSYPSGPVNQAGTSYQGEWNGAYQGDGSYQGQWEGVYRDAEGRAYQGQYSGRFIGDGQAVQAAPPQPAAPQFAQPYPNYEGVDQEELAYLERCNKSSGIGGAVVGGALGALAGNRIAGRGNRLGGSLIGGGLGAVAGAAIEQGTDRCRKLMKKYGGGREVVQQRPPVQQHGYPQQQGYPQQHGWQGGYHYPAYYYPQQQPTVTTIVVQSAPVTTTTTTTYVEEEVVYSKPTHKKVWKPAKKVWKAAPAAVKGCQQARCLYD